MFIYYIYIFIYLYHLHSCLGMYYHKGCLKMNSKRDIVYSLTVSKENKRFRFHIDNHVMKIM